MQHIDYLTLILDENFTYREMYDYARQELVDPETGEVLGIQLEPYLFSVNHHYNSPSTVSFFKGAETQGIELAKRYNLRVTRIDLALDLAVKNPATAYKRCRAMAEKKCEDNPNGPHFNLNIGKKKLHKGRHGFKIGADSNDNQLRVYERDAEEGGVAGIRIEYQFRRKVAEAVWDAIKDDPDNQELIRYQIDAAINRYHLGYIPLKVNEEAVLNIAEHNDKKGNTQAWITGTVLKACIRHFDTYGVNLVEQLKIEFDRCYQERAYRTTVEFRERNAIDESERRHERQIEQADTKFLQKLSNRKALSKKQADKRSGDR